ncbi:DUF4124 domain-containing protein [Legionella cardiaca]|uniref:DUF4124 domain-containing protein n=1 Tax=Legionella cardiaca TaxID=1071983 RepID=A0ABY8AUN3_9GAMM|nr:DUF4124 domain-containing protein [Legionella cardiaca]WED44188.1 DUF4124 domain-containing protein [Legionella cardiaca]
MFLVINPLFAEIYKWIDDQGITHFSDSPHEGGNHIKLPATQYNLVPVPAKKEKVVNQQQKLQPYELTIIQPEDKATIRNNQGKLIVNVHINQLLRPNYQLILVLDGKKVKQSKTTLTFILNGIERGTHNLVVEVLDEKDSVLFTSKPVIFYMHRPYIHPDHKI